MSDFPVICTITSTVIETIHTPTNNFITQAIQIREPILSAAQGPQGPKGTPGSHTLSGLTDIDLSNLKDGSVLVYRANSNTWESASSTVTISNTPPVAPIVGTMWWDGANKALMILNPLDNTWIPIVPQKSFSYTFTNSLVWLVTHNQNSRNFTESIMDSEGYRIIANIRIVDNNSFEVLLTTATTGTIDVTFK
jgi:hypothetical protein